MECKQNKQVFIYVEATKKSYYLSSANLQFSPAMANIAIHYEEVCHDYDKAITYYLEAIEYDEVLAMYNLADLYYKIKDFDKME